MDTMPDRMKWFDRVFELDLPLWMYPNVLERLRGTPARLEERVNGLSPQLRIQRRGEAWSIQENVGHLFDLEPLWAGRLDDLLSGGEVLRPADLTNAKTHEARHNSESMGDLLAQFRQLREAFVRRLEALDEGQRALTARHPRLDRPMRTIDLAFFMAEHDDHHLVTIGELIGP